MPLYIAKSGNLEGCHACLTDWLIHSQTKDSATQLLTKYKSGALVTQFIKQQRNPFINFDKLTRQWLDLGPIKKRVQFVGEIFDPEKELCKQPWWSFAAFPRPLCLCRSPPGECRAHLAKWQNWPWAHDSIWLHPLHTANSTQHIFQIKGKTGDTCVDD